MKEMKKIYIVAEMLDYGLYDMTSARAYETHSEALTAFESTDASSGFSILVLELPAKSSK